VLASDVMSNHSNPRMYWQPMSLDTEAPLAAPAPRHFHTMPGAGPVHRALNLEWNTRGLSGALSCLRQMAGNWMGRILATVAN
jgi:hypothetical protein